jgi:tripartite-type tricarboxylate transporter receptor subunit TctC
MVEGITSSIGYLKAGKLRPLGVTSAKRAAVLPDVPPIGDTVPGYDATGWFGLGAPKGTPQPIIDKLNATIAAVVTRPEVKKQFEEQGTEAASSTQAEMAKLLREEYARLGETAKRIGVAVN